MVKSPSSGVRENNNNKKNTFETRSGPPVGGLPNPSPTPTHQNCPSNPAGQTPPAGSSDRAAGRGLAGRPPPMPLLLPPCLNLSLQTARPDNQAARAASFKRRPRGVPAGPGSTPPRPASSNHQPSPRPALPPPASAPAPAPARRAPRLASPSVGTPRNVVHV